MHDIETFEDSNIKPVYKRNFILFSIARLISELGSSMLSIAVSLYILDLTGSASTFSMLMAFTTLPSVMVNIFAGVLVDRMYKKKVILACEMVSGLVVLIFLLILRVDSKSIWLFAIFIIVLNFIQSIFILALNSSIVNITVKENVARVNSSFQSIGAIVKVVGPICGAVAYKSIGLYLVILIDGVSFIFAGILETCVVFSKSTMEDSGKYMERFKNVYKYINTQKAMKHMLVTVVIFNFILSPIINVLLPYVCYQKIKISAYQLSLIQASWSGGFILGSIVVSIKKSINPILDKWFLLIVLQGGLIMTWCFPNLPVFNGCSKSLITIIFCLILVVTGTVNGIFNIPAFTFLQVTTPEKLRASVYGVVITATLISVPVGMQIYGLMIENINWAFIIVASAIMMMLLGINGHNNKILRGFFVTETKDDKCILDIPK